MIVLERACTIKQELIFELDFDVIRNNVTTQAGLTGRWSALTATLLNNNTKLTNIAKLILRRYDSHK